VNGRPGGPLAALALLLIATSPAGAGPQAAAPPAGDVPLAATVLGENVRTTDAVEMQQIILDRLFGEYAAAHDVEATAPETEAYLANMERVARQNRAEREARLAELTDRLAADDVPADERRRLEAERASLRELLASLEADENLSPDEALEVATMRRRIAEAMVERWQLNRALYREYGGRIVFQQLGPEPLDAYRQFLEQREREGAFTIYDDALEAEFWRYFTDESIHDFMAPGSDAEARAFEAPPWEAGTTAP
jgi:hypothetical protein